MQLGVLINLMIVLMSMLNYRYRTVPFGWSMMTSGRMRRHFY